ncbi:MAG TPA: phage tail protein, partial [Stellaceae bacterium]|nr:phage tail protein [Stellaceae bacterium]
MTISFNTIPQDWRVPGQFIEFDNSLAGKGLPLIPNKIMVFGQMLPGAQATPNVPVQVLSYAQAVALFGRGSMLAIMFNFLKLANPVTETWCIPQLDNAAGTAAAGSITVTGSPTVND